MIRKQNKAPYEERRDRYGNCDRDYAADLPTDNAGRIPDELARKGERKESRSISEG